MKLMITDLPGQGVLIRFPQELLSRYESSIEALNTHTELEVTSIYQSKNTGMVSVGVLFNEEVVDSVNVKKMITKAFRLE